MSRRNVLPDDITEDELLCLRWISEGADVRDKRIGRILRDLHRRAPDLFNICEPMGDYGVKDELPLFGAVVTRRAVRAAVESKLSGRAGLVPWRKR